MTGIYLADNIVNEYLIKVTERLESDGFGIKQKVSYENQVFEYVARRKRFEIEKFGIVTTVYTFAEFSSPDINSLRAYSKLSFRYALKVGGIHPPRGALYALFCFPVAIVDSIDADTGKIILTKDPPKHWAAVEMLVVVRLEQKTLYYCDTTPEWGRLYYDQMRININAMLYP